MKSLEVLEAKQKAGYMVEGIINGIITILAMVLVFVLSHSTHMYRAPTMGLAEVHFPGLEEISQCIRERILSRLWSATLWENVEKPTLFVAHLSAKVQKDLQFERSIKFS